MTLQIKKNKALKLDIPEFICDGGLSDHLNEYDMLKHLNAYTFDVLIGKPGSGKTSLMVSLLNGKGKNRVYRKVFNHILVVMPSTSIASMKKNIFEKLPNENMYDELTMDSIEDIYDKLLQSSEENENTLLILDDIGASLKDKEIQKILKKIIYNRRHLKVKIVCFLFLYHWK